MIDEQRYATCPNCAHAMLWEEHKALFAQVSCPFCGRPNSFGPGIYVEEYNGKTMEEVIQHRQERRIG